MWRATTASLTARLLTTHFNPRPPWGGRQDLVDSALTVVKFQSTPCQGKSMNISRNFNPRPPWGGRPGFRSCRSGQNHFNPRPPWGGRLYKRGVFCFLAKSFQSTPSVGRATLRASSLSKSSLISIHALRGEGDASIRFFSVLTFHFNPRPPWGGRPALAIIARTNRSFQSTPSVGRATSAIVVAERGE